MAGPGDDEQRWAELGHTTPDDRLLLMEAVVRAGIDAIVVTELDDDAEPRIIFVNDAFTQQTGWSFDEVVHQHPRLLVSEDTALEPQLELRDAVANRSPATVELQHRRKDGSTFWVENTILPVGVSETRTHVISFQRNISARKRSERALRESEERFRALAEHASDVITVLDGDGSFRYTSPSVEWLLGHSLGDYSSMFELVHPDDRAAVARAFAEVLAEPGLGAPAEFRLAHADGSWREVEAIGKNLLDDPLVEGIVVTVRDITDRKRAERVLAGQAEVLELLLAGRPLSESLGAVASLVEAQSPGTRCAVLGHDHRSGGLSCLAAPSLPASFAAAVEALDPGGGSACQLACRDALPVVVADATDDAGQLARLVGSVSSWAMPVLAPDGAVVAVLTAYHDRMREPTPAEWQVLERVTDLVAVVLERERAAAELAHRVTHDPLTDLPNRTLVVDRLRLALARLERRQQCVAVLAVTVDRFEMIADSMGHEAAEDVRTAVAARLERTRRPEDTVGDLGGVFVVVAEAVDAVRGATALADRVARAVAAPHALRQGTVFLGCSIGISLGTSPNDGPELLIDDAVTAMRRAASAGGGRYEVFDAALRDRVVERVQVENGLHRALQRSEFVLHYQPVLRTSDGMPVSVEALVRWLDPERGLVGPGEFIHVAEDIGLIVRLGEWVLRTACSQLAAWKRDGVTGAGFTVAVNVSPRQLGDRLVQTVMGSVEAAGLQPDELCVEVTETAVMSDLGVSLGLLAELRSAGVGVALDDFGTGHSSLALLRRLPANLLKIDRSFVAELGSADAPIANVVVALAHGLGLTAVAEGVETQAQLAALQQLGCDYTQGYLHCPPLPADEAARWLRRRQPVPRPASS